MKRQVEHGWGVCPVYGLEVLGDEQDRCTLCGAMEHSTSVICVICKDAGKRRASFPISTDFKEDIASHIQAHEAVRRLTTA